MNLDPSSEEVVIIRTLECDLCMKFDSILLPKSEISHLTKQNDLNIGSHIVNHNDHIRIVYFDDFGAYLGDTISLSVIQKPLQDINSILPNFPLDSPDSTLQRLQKRMLRLFVSKSYNLAIVGPSMAGKTSLALFLETGVPERYSKRVNHSPTMGQSVRHIKLGRSDLTIYDMGGQRDFWDNWKDSIANSSKIIFVFDGTANNEQEVLDALGLVLNQRKSETKVLILMNKLDLVIDGYVKHFMKFNNVLSKIDTNLDNVWILKSSVYNGTAYLSEDQGEKNLAEIINKFLLS